MALVTVRPRFYWPSPPILFNTGDTNNELNGTGQRLALIGYVQLATGPGTSKVLSTGSIRFRTGAVTFANGGSSFQIGIQDVATASGPTIQPDGSFDVSTTLTGGGGGITANAWQTITMTTGTKTIADGDFIAIVFDFVARAGADLVRVEVRNKMAQGDTNLGLAAFFVSSWSTNASHGPGIEIAFDDGTLGWLADCPPNNTTNSETFTDSTNPDERGLIFQLPFDCTVDGMYLNMSSTAATGDGTGTLYTAPTTAAAAISGATGNLLGEQIGNIGVGNIRLIRFASLISLSKNTNYGMAYKATGAGNFTMYTWTLSSTNSRAFWANGTTIGKITRNNSSGNFTAESPATTMYQMGLSIAQITDGAAAGGGGFPVIGGWN